IGNLRALLRRELGDGRSFPGRAARGRHSEPRQNPQQRRLARPVRAHQQRELRGAQLEVQLLEETTFSTPHGHLPSAQQRSVRHEQECLHRWSRGLCPTWLFLQPLVSFFVFEEQSTKHSSSTTVLSSEFPKKPLGGSEMVGNPAIYITFLMT